jgi:hypothetical protein
MATLTVQESVFTGLAFTYENASTGDTFTNDGHTFLVFLNGNASSRTLTITGNAFSKPGFGDVSAADAGETVTLPGSGTNGGRQIVGRSRRADSTTRPRDASATPSTPPPE